MALCLALAAPGVRSASADEAKERTSSLSWVRLEGAESCIATQALARAVEDRLARRVFVSAAEADVSVEGHLSKEGKQWKAVLTIRDSSGALLGTRTLDSEESECSALDEGLVFVVSVLIDPDAALVETREETPEPPKPPTAQDVPPRVVVRRERVLVPVRSKQDPWRVEISALFKGALGLLPAPALGVGAAVLLEPPGFWDIEISAAYFFGGRADAERGASADLSLLHGGAALCPLALKGSRVSYHTCAGLLLGALRSRGSGFDTELPDNNTPSVYAALPNRFTVKLAGPVALTAGLSLLAPLVRSTLTYRGPSGSENILYEPSSLAVSGAVGASFLFPSP